MAANYARLGLGALMICSTLISFSGAVQPGGLACEGCHGVVTELHEKLRAPNKMTYEDRVSNLLGRICQTENLVKYVYSPPKMVRACNELLAQHRPEITDSLIDHFDENPDVTAGELEADICFTISKSCEGIKESPDAKVSDTVVADQMLDASSGQNIVLEEVDGKIVPQIKDAPKEKSGDKKKESKKEKKDKPKKGDSEDADDKKSKKENAEKKDKKHKQKTEL